MSETNQKEDKLITNTPTTPEGNDAAIPLKSFNGNQRFIVTTKLTGRCCCYNCAIFLLEIILFSIFFCYRNKNIYKDFNFYNYIFNSSFCDNYGKEKNYKSN